VCLVDAFVYWSRRYALTISVIFGAIYWFFASYVSILLRDSYEC
jgi:hypothetical protein